jgi:hypothetical protein
MATKKPVKSSQKPVSKPAAKTALKKATKPVVKKVATKANVKTTAKSVVGALTKMVSKVADKMTMKPSPPVKNGKAKPLKSSMTVETRVEKAKIDSGGTLIEMAKEEMHHVNAPAAEAADKAEKVGKFKPIKLERGNLADEKAKWQELFKRYGKDKAVNYKMSEQFESLKPINHKVLGWGFVLTSENNRLEILFENGIKLLICNYKP